LQRLSVELRRLADDLRRPSDDLRRRFLTCDAFPGKLRRASDDLRRHKYHIRSRFRFRKSGHSTAEMSREAAKWDQGKFPFAASLDFKIIC
jgi:hypothetical protein